MTPDGEFIETDAGCHYTAALLNLHIQDCVAIAVDRDDHLIAMPYLDYKFVSFLFSG